MDIYNHKIQHILYILFSMVSFFYLSSCQDDKYAEASTNEEHGIPVTVSMNIKVATYETPADEAATTSTRTDKEELVVTFSEQSTNKEVTRASTGITSLYNFWVLQFGEDKAVRKIAKISNTPEPIKDMVTIDTELFAGENQTIYLVSLGKKYADVDLSGIKKIADLENYTLDYLEYVDGTPTPRITEAVDVPYWGYHGGIDIVQLGENGKGYVKYDPTNNFDGGISMRAMLAKVTLNFSYSVSRFTPLYLMVNKVPTKFAVNYENYQATSFADLTAIQLDANLLKDGKRLEYTWYLPPNPQGKVDKITSQSQRFFYYDSKGKAQGTAPSNGTYINLWASDDSSIDNYAFYYIFLGCNTTNDFNVYPASYYNMRSDINVSPSENDGRVVSNKLQQTVDIIVSDRIPYSPFFKKAGSGYDLDAHPGMRPMELTMLRGSVDISILETDAKNATSISPARSWLKLSTYSNYTDAYNASIGGNSNGLNTSLTLNANIPKVFKLYLYNDEYESYSMDDLSSINTGKRSLYLRFNFHAESGVTGTYTARLDQRPAFYVGQFGGENRNNDGSYSEGLVFENVKESDALPSRMLDYYLMPTIYRGYYNTEWANLQTYDIENKVSGRKATRYLSENSSHFSFANPNKGSTVDAPRWVNGIPDLYQYTYYTNNGFGVRYCYDKNRDSNGNGRIDENELIWYMPSYYQNLAVNFNYYGNNAAIRKLFPSDAGRYSTTMYGLELAYNVHNDRPYLRNTALTVLNQERCVRNVKLSTNSSFPTGAKVSVEDGYAVIDATGFVAGSYVDNVNTPFFTDAAGRVKRHTLDPNGGGSDGVSQKVSARFRVAPEDLPTFMSWAEASGLNTAGNQSELDIPISPAPTGCAMYDSSNPGKWRLPTGRELVLIEMMEEALLKTSTTTGFLKLTEGISYWSASERVNNAAFPLSPQRYIYSERNSKKETEFAVRCIQDLPVK